VASSLWTVVRLRIDDRRSDRQLRLVQRIAHGVLEEPEFASYVDGVGIRRALIDETLEQSGQITGEYRKQRRTFHRRCRSTIAAGLIGVGAAILAALTVVHQVETAPAERGRLIGAALAAVGAFWRLIRLPGQVLAAALAMVLVVALVARAVEYGRQLWTEDRRCRGALLEPARVALRLAISGLANDAEAPVLHLRSAPGLSSASDPLHRVRRAEIDRINSLMRQLGASAVAVSGPRGAGKSTLLRGLMDTEGPPMDLVVHVEAASSYPARDFTILLYRALCETVVAQIRRDRRWWELFTDRLPRLPWRHGTREMLHRARAELHQLRFLQNVSHEVNGAVKLRGGLSLGGRRTRQLIEQPVSLPDLVRSFRAFTRDVVRWWSTTRVDSGELVIIIDELDRINDGDAAERFINEIKGVFGVRGCTYFVTISDDALAMFERRMIGARPALDSTFDEVLRLGTLTLEGSVGLLARRLVGCPRPFMALCHALSGGLPRELIRAARALIDAAGGPEASASPDRGLAALTARTVAADIRKLKFGFAPRLRGDAPAGSINNVLMMLADDGWPGTTAKEMLEHGAELIYRPPTDVPASDRGCLQLGVSLWFYATILETFGCPAEPTRPCHPRLDFAAENLAGVRSVMPQSTELALSRLIRLRTELELHVPLPDGSLTVERR
jgi:AAA ATPase domain